MPFMSKFKCINLLVLDGVFVEVASQRSILMVNINLKVRIVLGCKP
jgi:hypothetical protein